MKKFTFLRNLLVAAGLLVGSSAWAQITYISELPFETGFEENDPNPFDSGASITNENINIGNVLHVGTSSTATATFGDAAGAYELQNGEEVTVTFMAYHGWASNLYQTISLRNSDGQDLVSYDYKTNNTTWHIQDIKIAGKKVNTTQIEAQSRKSDGKGANGLTNSPYISGKGNTPVITMIIRQSGTVTFNIEYEALSIKESFTGEITDLKKDIKLLVLRDDCTVEDRTLCIDNLKITSEISTVQQYSYTINYVDKNNSNSIIKTEKGVGNEGSTVIVSTADFWQDGKKYKYVSDDAANQILQDDNTVITVICEEAEKYDYTFTSSYNGQNLDWHVKGTAYEGEILNILYPRFQAIGNVLVGRAPVNNDLNKQITMGAANYTEDLEYTSEGIEDLYILSEAENLGTDLMVGTPSFSYRVSNQKVIYGTEGTLFSLPAGKYVFTLGVIGGNTTNHIVNYTVSAGGEQIIEGICNSNFLTLLKSKEFTLNDETEITFTGSDCSGDRGIDLVYVQKTGDVKTISAGYGTYYSEKALDFSETGLTAYIATGYDDETVILKEVTSVPANTGVLLVGNAKTYEIPVATGATDDVRENKFEGVTKATEVNRSIYVLYDGEDGVGFYKTTATTFTVGANTAYLPVSGGASKLRLVFEGNDATGIEAVEANEASATIMYNVAGQRVGDSYKGIVIKNGKKYLNK